MQKKQTLLYRFAILLQPAMWRPPKVEQIVWRQLHSFFMQVSHVNRMAMSHMEICFCMEKRLSGSLPMAGIVWGKKNIPGSKIVKKALYFKDPLFLKYIALGDPDKAAVFNFCFFHFAFHNMGFYRRPYSGKLPPPLQGAGDTVNNWHVLFLIECLAWGIFSRLCTKNMGNCYG